MRQLLFFLLLFHYTFCFSQNETPLAKKGTITLADNGKIQFNNLRLANGKFVFMDIASSSEKELPISDIKYIEDEQMSRVFSNKTVIDKAREADLKLEEEQKAIALEESNKREIAYKKKQEADKKRLALGLYPPGIYKTKEDFIAKTPQLTNEVTPKGLVGFEKPTLYDIADNCFFYDTMSDEKIKKVFAISYKGNLYFQIRAILENRNETDRAQSNDFPDGFVRVLSSGQNYYYLELNLVNGWAQALAYNGGVAGGAIEGSLHNQKGIVWDIKNSEFNIFKNCKDYNDFIKPLYPEGVQECKKQQPDILLIRKAIEIIK